MCRMKPWNLPGETHEQSLARHIAEYDAMDRYEYNLYDECASLHCSLTGASDPDCKGMNAARARLIRRRLDGWRSSEGAWWHRYDEAVKAMCEAVLAEYEGSSLQQWEQTP